MAPELSSVRRVVVLAAMGVTSALCLALAPATAFAAPGQAEEAPTKPTKPTSPPDESATKLQVESREGRLKRVRQEPTALIRDQYAQFDQLVAGGMEVEPMRAEIVKRMDDFVDFVEFARLTVKEQWDDFSPAQRDEYVSLFKQLIQRTYSRKFKPDRKLTVTYHGDAERKQDRARLKTTIASGGIEADVEYRFLRIDPSGWWVFDIVIDDVSLMRNYRSQFQRIVKSDGIEALFTKLRERVESGEE